MAEEGTLSLVGTPIGNLGDITLRALETLKQADIVAAEDTRRTRLLLKHYGITTRLLSFHAHNLRSRVPRIIKELEAGRRVALVSDAGMPGISDPGGELVAAAARQGIRVEVVPGPTAVSAAVALAAIPAPRFSFEGFLPARDGPRRKRLRELVNDPRTLVFYEAPHRLIETLADMKSILGDRRAALARELTKLHEETLRGSLSELLSRLRARRPRGEFTIVCEGYTKSTGAASGVPQERLEREFRYLTDVEGLTRRDAVKELATRHGMPRQALYRLLSG